MKKMLISSLVACATAAALSAPLAQADARYNAGNKLGFYAGGSYGLAKSRGGEFDDDNGVLEAMVGFKFNPYFGVEGMYTNFGDFGNSAASASVDGYGVAAVGSWPMSETFSVYGKAGMFFSTVDVDIVGFDSSYDDEQLFFGLGADFAISDPLSVFVEYDRYRVNIGDSEWPEDFDDSDVDIDALKVGLKFKF